MKTKRIKYLIFSELSSILILAKRYCLDLIIKIVVKVIIKRNNNETKLNFAKNAFVGITKVINMAEPTMSALIGSRILRIEIPKRVPGIKIKNNTESVVPKTSVNLALSKNPGKKINKDEMNQIDDRNTKLLLFLSVLSTSQL
jgi:hypothetical protein